MSTKEPKARRPKARTVPIIIAVMEDRVALLIAAKSDPIYVELHASRLLELMNELTRSTNGGKTAETEEVSA